MVPWELYEEIKKFVTPSTWKKFVFTARKELVYLYPRLYIANWQTVPNEYEARLITTYSLTNYLANSVYAFVYLYLSTF